MFQVVQLKMDSTVSRGQLPCGTARLMPRARAMAIMPTAPPARHSVRNCQMVSSLKAIFMTGQFMPQNKAMAAIRKSPSRGMRVFILKDRDEGLGTRDPGTRDLGQNRPRVFVPRPLSLVPFIQACD